MNRNQLGSCRLSLNICFINAGRLTTEAIHKVGLNSWNAHNRRFKHLTAKFKSRVQKWCPKFRLIPSFPNDRNDKRLHLYTGHEFER